MIKLRYFITLIMANILQNAQKYYILIKIRQNMDQLGIKCTQQGTKLVFSAQMYTYLNCSVWAFYKIYAQSLAPKAKRYIGHPRTICAKIVFWENVKQIKSSAHSLVNLILRIKFTFWVHNTLTLTNQSTDFDESNTLTSRYPVLYKCALLYICALGGGHRATAL